MACHSSSSHILLKHPAPVPCVIAVDRRVWLARAPACLPFVQRDDALPSGMRRIDAAIRRDMRDRLDSWGNLHLVTPRIGCVVGIPTSACLHFCRPRSPVGCAQPHLKRVRTRPGRRTGTANSISSSLAYSLHENQCGSACAAKNRAPRPGRAARTFGDATASDLRRCVMSRWRLPFSCDLRRGAN